MFAARCNYRKIVNYLSLRTKNLDQEDSNSITILVHQLFSNDLQMASRLLVRGSDINYANKNGYTALHICIQNKLV